MSARVGGCGMGGVKGKRGVHALVGVGFLVVLGLGGCSLSGTAFQSPEQGAGARPQADGEKEGEVKHAVPVELRALKSPSDSLSAIEVVWEVPAEPVEGFIVRYGDAHEALTDERRLTIANLERIEDPARGRLYRYVIEGIPTTRRVFLTIAAFSGGQESPPSKVFEVFPGTPE